MTVILYPLSFREDIDTRFLLIPSKNSTSCSRLVMLEPNLMLQVPTPFIGCTKLSPMVTSSSIYFSIVSRCSRNPILCLDYQSPMCWICLIHDLIVLNLIETFKTLFFIYFSNFRIGCLFLSFVRKICNIVTILITYETLYFRHFFFI